MLKVGSYEAKTHLPRLLARVAAGESVIITRHGEEVAHLVPPPHKRFSRKAFQEARAKWEKARKGVRLNALKIRDLINEGGR